MFIVNSISADAKQKQTLLLEDGTKFQIQMEYKPLQYGWFFKSIVYEDFELTNIRICNSPNLLHQYKNQIPFGIAITCTGGFEPTQQQDFLERRAIMYILTQDECDQYTEYLQNG